MRTTTRTRLPFLIRAIRKRPKNGHACDTISTGLQTFPRMCLMGARFGRTTSARLESVVGVRARIVRRFQRTASEETQSKHPAGGIVKCFQPRQRIRRLLVQARASRQDIAVAELAHRSRNNVGARSMRQVRIAKSLSSCSVILQAFCSSIASPRTKWSINSSQAH